MTNLKPVDVAIIGGGWTGLLTAKEITEKTSLSVAVFERGGPRKLADYAVTMDELDYNIRLRMMQNTAEETITHRHSLKDSAVPVRQHGSFHPGTGTGGAGEHPYVTPAANLSEPYKNPDGIMRGACQYCGHCQRFGCMVGAKAQPSNLLMPVLGRRKNFEFRTGSWVRRIVHKDGRATGIQFTGENGEEFFQPASTVVLASFTLNNTRLLLLSKIGTPYDPNTGKGTLGRNLTHQVGTNTRVFFDKPLNAFMGAGELGSRISDFDGDLGFTGAEGEPLRLGGIALSMNGDGPIGSFGIMPPGESKSNWG